MSSRSFTDITQKQWENACLKLGLEVEKKYGKGSHILILHPKTGRKYTIQKKLHKFINIKIFKKLLEWGLEENDIWKVL